MALLKGVGKYLLEVAGDAGIIGGLRLLWNFFKKGATNPYIQDVLKSTMEKRLNKEKGLESPAIFANLLAKADFGGTGSEDKKIVLRDAMNEMETEDRRNGTHYASHFRIMMALETIENGGLVVTRDATSGNIIKTEPAQGYQRAGLETLKGLSKMCKTKEDWKATIIMIGAMHDHLLDTFEHWLVSVAWPAVKNYASDLSIQAETLSASLRIMAETRSEEYREPRGIRGFFRRFISND
jgi:hypothetical protein